MNPPAPPGNTAGVGLLGGSRVVTFRCVTFGCRVNQYETQAVREALLRKGFREAPEERSAEWVVINSCTVTEAADRECLSLIGKLTRENPGVRVAVAGCGVQRDHALLSRQPGVRLLVGTGQKHRIADLIAEMDLQGPAPFDPQRGLTPKGSKGARSPRLEAELSRVYSPLTVSGFEGRSKAFVKVQDGCDRACAFCKIPYVRGRSRSRPLKEVLEEVRRLTGGGLPSPRPSPAREEGAQEEGGFREVVLTGVAIGLWGREFRPACSLADLVTAVDRLPGDFRIRLSSLDPRDLDDRLIETLTGASKVCRHLHLSLQAGADPVLKRMNRGHTTAWYAERVGRVRAAWPDLGLTTDLIAGFPGETEPDFEQTLAFCRRMRFARVHVFPYSPRRSTSAWAFRDRLAPRVVKERARRLRRAAAQTAEQFARSLLGTEQEVLLEEEGTVGYTGQFVRVLVRGGGARVGQLARVRLTGLEAGMLTGVFLRRHP